MSKHRSRTSKRRPPAPLVATTAVAALGVGILAVTQTGTAPTPTRSPEREPRVPAPLSSSASSPTWTVITLTGFDANGEPVAIDFDFHPLARFDIWNSGRGDTNLDGVVDLADLNLVLEHMGTDYEAPASGGTSP